MKQINLYETYRKVKQRINKSSGKIKKSAAEKATKAAKDILDRPTLKLVDKFRKIEQEWRLYAHGNSVSIADEFEKAIRSKNYIIEQNYSSHAAGWNPKTGYLYCFSTRDYPGFVKIGATTRLCIEKRAEEYRVRRKLSNIKIICAYQTENPSKKEAEIHECLREYKVYPLKIRKSNEWFKISQKRAKLLIQSKI
jgi:hypothetical protein